MKKLLQIAAVLIATLMLTSSTTETVNANPAKECWYCFYWTTSGKQVFISNIYKLRWNNVPSSGRDHYCHKDRDNVSDKRADVLDDNKRMGCTPVRREAKDLCE